MAARLARQPVDERPHEQPAEGRCQGAAPGGERSGRFRPRFKWWFWILVFDFLVLTWCGSQLPEPPYSTISLIATIYWFAHFLVVLPLLGLTEKPLPPPETIEADFDAHYPPKPAEATGSAPAATPAE